MSLKLIDGKLRFEEKLLQNIREKKNNEVIPILTSEVVCNNVSDSTGTTLLHVASMYGNVDVVLHLLHLSVNVNARDELGQTPLLLAVTRRMADMSRETIVHLLHAKANIFEANAQGTYPLQCVVDNREFANLSVVKDFFEALRESCQNDEKTMADQLIKAGCPLERAIYLGNANVTEIMINAGCEVDARHPHEGHTALHLAAGRMDGPNIQILIKYGADVTARMADHFLPLSLYLIAGRRLQRRQNPRVDIIRCLMDRYFSGDNKTNVQNTSFEHILKFGTKEAIQCAFQYDVNFDMTSDFGNGVLHCVAMNRNPDVTVPFENRINDVNARNQNGTTPLHYAAAVGRNASTVKFLLENGAHVNAKTNMGNTALLGFFVNMPAIPVPEEKEIVELLLQHDADIQVVSPEGQETLFDFVVETQRFNLGELLMAKLVLREKLGEPIRDLIRSKIESHRRLKPHHDLCQIDLENMKKVAVYESITVYKLLMQSEEEIVKCHAYNDELLQEFENFDAKYCSQSNYYYDILRARIESVLPKVKLIRDATNIIFSRILPNINNNYLVARKIINYLDYEDMIALNNL